MEGVFPIIIRLTIGDLKSIFLTERPDSIKRSLQSAAIAYELEGRGKGAVYTFTYPQSIFKLLMIKDYGFTPNRYMDTLFEFFKGYFFCTRPFARMFLKDIAEVLDVSEPTIRAWMHKFYDGGLLARGIKDGTSPICYCTSFKVDGKREVIAIKEEQYLQANARYSAALAGGATQLEANKARRSVTGGNVFALQAEAINALCWNALFDEIAFEFEFDIKEMKNQYE